MHAEPTAPSPRDASPAPCLALTLRFGASVLAVTHLTPPRSFHVGEGGLDAGCDAPLPASILGAPRAPLVLVEDGAVELVLLAGMTGTLTLDGEPARSVAEVVASEHARVLPGIAGATRVRFPLGSKADLDLGGVSIEVASSAEAHPTIGRTFADRKNLAFVSASALVQIGLLGALAFAAPPPHADIDGISSEQLYALQTALAEFDEKQQAEAETEEISETTADAKEGGVGTRARGEEASMGNPYVRPTAQRFGTQGPADNPDPHIARAEALRAAAEFGMIGLLNSGAGGDPSASSAPIGFEGWAPGGSGAPGGGFAASGAGTIGHGAGLGSAQGFGAGAGRLSGSHRPRSPRPVSPTYAAPPQSLQAPQPVVAPAPATEALLDPNGRFATTYRPGGGHLAAFESAIARGIVPSAAREMVSDIGARYAPQVPVAAGHALGLRADLERTALAPGGGPVHLRLALRSSAEHPAARPHLSVHLVLDVSGSMKGDSIACARSAADALVDKLAPGDDFSLTTFSSDATLAIPDGPVGPRRGFIHQVIAGIHEDGGTNIGAGLELGYAQASLPGVPEDAIKVVLLVSDGHANAGITRSESLSRLALDAFQRGIQTSSFGLGAEYDGALMSSIAADGAGGYYYLRDGEQIAPALTNELDRRLDPVATAVELRVRLKSDVGLVHVYGSRRLDAAEAQKVRLTEIAVDRQASARDHIKQDRHDDSEGGLRFFMPAFARDDGHAFLLQLQVPDGVGARDLAGIELKYKDRLTHKNVVEELPIHALFADSDAASASTIDASVSRTVQGFAAGEALAEASTRIAHGDRDGAASLLDERELILRSASTTLHEPLFLRDAERLSSLRTQTAARDKLGDPLVLAMLLETAGHAHLR